MSQRARKLLHQIIGPNRPPVFTGEVVEVDYSGNLCAVQPDDGSPIVYGVRLSHDPDSENVIWPKMRSRVLCAWLDDQLAVVLQVKEAILIQFLAGPTSLTLDEQGLSVERSFEDLKSLMVDLVTATRAIAQNIQALTVTCAAPGSPSSPPVNVASFVSSVTELQGIQNRFETLLK